MEQIDRRWRPGGCWRWKGQLDKDGYPVFWVKGDDGRWRAVRAHRWIYEQLVDTIPPGHTLDHACHTRSRRCQRGRRCQHRACVRPLPRRRLWGRPRPHLEPMTLAENQRRARDRRRGVSQLGA